jgi:hypothetical protein
MRALPNMRLKLPGARMRLSLGLLMAACLAVASPACRPADRAPTPSTREQTESPSSEAPTVRPLPDCEGGDSNAATPLVTAECIGPLAVDATLGTLRAKFPATDTVWYGEPGYPPYAAWKFAPHGLVAVATQFHRPVNPNTPAEAWGVRPGPGVLPGGVPLNTTWAQLRKTYGGPVIAGGTWYLGAEFCALPGVMFELAMDPSFIKYDGSGNPLNLDDSARVEAVDIIHSRFRGSCPVETK